MLSRCGLLPALVLMAATVANAADVTALDEACVLDLVQRAEASMTMAEVRRQCTPKASATTPIEAAAPTAEVSKVEQRLAYEHQAGASPFSILSHRPNYFLFGAFNAEGWDPTLFQEQTGDPDLAFDDYEGQFQISLKVPLATGLLGKRLDLYGAYTNRSFWQMYNSENSRPFRETNHEPEIWAQFRNDWQIWGLENSLNTVGFVHQSNGRSGVLSRSWNRVYATFLFERGNWAFAFKPWVWLSSDKDDSDNPDIDDYMGHGEFRAVYGRNGHVLSTMLRNQLESGFDRGAVELSWSFPVFDYPYLKGYVQYFYGYGESLIDYDRKVNRIGLGISISDWLD